MASMDELFDQYAVLKPEFDRLSKEMEAMKVALAPFFNEAGEELTSKSGVTIRMQTRRVMDDAELEKRIGPSKFRMISKRVSVAALLKAAVTLGKIKKADVDASYTESKPWFTIL